MSENRNLHRLAIAVSAGLLAMRAHAAEPADARTIIEDWPEVARMAAQAMLDKYGDPDGATEEMLVWHENGPWLKTVVYSEEIDHDFPMPHKDVLEQTIAYDVPADKLDELAAYDGSIVAFRTAGFLSARCDKEAANFLALNLADRIVNDELTVEEAREQYAEAIRSFMAGEPVALMQGLEFEPPSLMAAAFSDEALIETPAQ